MCTNPLSITISSPLLERTGVKVRTSKGRVSVSRSEVYKYKPDFVLRPYRDGTYTCAFVNTSAIPSKHLSKYVFANLEDAKFFLDGATYQPFTLLDGSVKMLVDCGHCEECLRKRKRRIQTLVKYDIKFTKYCENFMLTLSYDSKHLHTDTDRARHYYRGGAWEKVSRCSVAKLKSRPLGEGTSAYLDNNIFFNSLSAIHELQKDCSGYVAPQTVTSSGNSNYQHCDTGFLEYSDFSTFIKRLRTTLYRWYDVTAVKFVMCGEYGSGKTYIDDYGHKRNARYRPHYHVSLWYSRTDKCNGYIKEGYNPKSHRGKRSIFDQHLSMNGGKVPALTEGFMRVLCSYLWSDLGSQSVKYGVKCERARNREACGAYVCKYISKQLAASRDHDCYANKIVPMYVRTSILLADRWIDLLSHHLGEDVYSYKEEYFKDGKRVSRESFFPYTVLKRVAIKRNSNPYEVLNALVKRIEEIEASMTDGDKMARFKYIKNSISADISATSKML